MFAPLITDILRLIDDQINAVKKMREGKGITVRFMIDAKIYMSHSP